MYRKAARFLSRHGVMNFEPIKTRFIPARIIKNNSLENVMYQAIKKAVEEKELRFL